MHLNVMTLSPSGSTFDIELNTPQISEDQTDPLMRLFGKSDQMLQFCLINVKALTTQQFDIDCMKYESIWSFSHLVELDDNLLLPDQVIIKG